MPTPVHPETQFSNEEMRDIISRVPSWLLRWGTSAFFGIFTLLLLMSWLVRYPDVLKARFNLTSLNAPKPVHARTDGKLVKLLAREQMQVAKNQVLAHLESTAEPEQVLALEKDLDSLAALLNREQLDSLVRRPNSLYDHLGELQTAYQVFDQAYLNMLSYLSSGFYLTKKSVLKRGIQDLEHMNRVLLDQREIYARDFELAQQAFDVQQQLAREGVIAPMEVKQEESRLLTKKMPLKQIEAALVANHSERNVKWGEMLELDKQISEQKNIFRQSLNTLRSAIEGWKIKYLLVAPMAGRIYFSTLVEENQSVRANQEIFFIASEKTSYYGELHVPQYNLGKVKEGQRVMIKFAGYPYEEFGVVEGKIAYISEIPGQDSTFLAKVMLPKGLTSQYGKRIKYREGMLATGEIVTDNLRLLERIFFQFRKVGQR